MVDPCYQLIARIKAVSSPAHEADRDKWTEAFQELRRCAKHIRDMEDLSDSDRRQILKFLHTVPSMSKVSTRQVKYEWDQLLRNRLWETTASSFVVLWRADSGSQSAGPGAMIHQPTSLKRYICVFFAFVVVLGLIFAQCYLQRTEITRLVAAFRPGFARVNKQVILHCFKVVAELACIPIVVALLGNLCWAAVSSMDFPAFVVIALSTCSFIMALTWGISNCLEGHFVVALGAEAQSRTRIHVPGIMPLVVPWVTWFVFSLYGILSHLLAILSQARARVYRMAHCHSNLLGYAITVRHVGKEYSDAAFDKELMHASSAAKLAKKYLKQTPLGQRSSPLLGTCVEEVSPPQGIAGWSRFLQLIVHDTDPYRFDLADYEDLINAVQSGERATMCGLFRFVCLFVPTLCRVACPAFRRNLSLEDAKTEINKARECCAEHERKSWQLLVDQYDWYLKNGYALCDVMSKLASRKDMAGVLRLLKSIDDVLAFWLSLLCLKPLWIPSPQQRKNELSNRLELVCCMASGQYVLTAPYCA